MGGKARETSEIESFEAQTKKPDGKMQPRTPTASGHVGRPNQVHIHYPSPTPLGVIIKDVAQWSGKVFVMEPSSNVKLQIFAASPLSRQQAWLTFLASLSVVNLRAVEIDHVVKIVPIIKQVSA